MQNKSNQSTTTDLFDLIYSVPVIIQEHIGDKLLKKIKVYNEALNFLSANL